jgi:monodehydroascorbate reductase (NADH)
VGAIKSCCRGNAVVIGGGYIEMEYAAALVTKKTRATMVFLENTVVSSQFHQLEFF